MRVCVLYCSNKTNDQNLKALASKMAQALSENNHNVDVFDMSLEIGKKISIYDYAVFITCAQSLFSKNIPSDVQKFLNSAGTISGKKCSCYITKKGCIRKAVVLHTLMRTIEAEGMFLKVSDVLTNPNYAYAVAKRLHIANN